MKVLSNVSSDNHNKNPMPIQAEHKAFNSIQLSIVYNYFQQYITVNQHLEKPRNYFVKIQFYLIQRVCLERNRNTQSQSILHKPPESQPDTLYYYDYLFSTKPEDIIASHQHSFSTRKSEPKFCKQLINQPIY